MLKRICRQLLPQVLFHAVEAMEVLQRAQKESCGVEPQLPVEMAGIEPASKKFG